jgi:hypothetical protein
MQFDLSINGKAVHLKQRLPLKDGHRLPLLLKACEDGDLLSQVKVLSLVVESWDYEGDPAQASAYDELDVFTEIIPMATAAAEHLVERMGGADTKG